MGLLIILEHFGPIAVLLLQVVTSSFDQFNWAIGSGVGVGVPLSQCCSLYLTGSGSPGSHRAMLPHPTFHLRTFNWRWWGLH